MMYDAGTYEDKGATCVAAVREIIPERTPIDLPVHSHTPSPEVGRRR